MCIIQLHPNHTVFGYERIVMLLWRLPFDVQNKKLHAVQSTLVQWRHKNDTNQLDESCDDAMLLAEDYIPDISSNHDEISVQARGTRDISKNPLGESGV
jgi:hypothetical protein